MARLHRDILRTLLGRIATGNPPAGAKLPKEVDLAAERPASTLERLEAAVEAVEAAAEADAGLEAARREFDEALAEAAGNRALARVARDLAAALGGPAPARPDRYRRVLDAIRAGDPAAARATMAAVSGARPR